MNTPNTIYLASALITDKNNRLLTVRKKTSTYYMMAGGKLELGETPEQALIRELNEELHLIITSKDIKLLGTHTTKAVNEANTIVTAHIYHLVIDDMNITVSAEIAEAKWLTQENYKETKLAHLLEEFSIPIWLRLF
ncbi:MAG: NUDIX domain-containing protein [Myroides sp.]|jgi:ADP-ribose pyrophosphatase YjhB (NUDIX family)|uniref:NUDIX hydrolase n=1 Tax=Myroides marinus TaxID=703342 RepID=A0A165Q455_9FLAO|nr:NUDIX domain-containing protein [Myroides marinus]KUF44009.1 NUDIX hydrolase [Myroides marinus]KZE73614.1 NUDIX hydrolase [Myroides marinus]MDR0195643.1 NUDIX domain-containing protein [Myroides sp.]